MAKAFIGFIAAMAVLWASSAVTQTADPEPAAKIVVDPPLAEPLSGRRVHPVPHQNLQIVPVLPEGARCDARIGHLHVAVDGAPWVWAETGGGPLIVAGLPAGPHKIEITLYQSSAPGSNRRRRIRDSRKGGEIDKGSAAEEAGAAETSRVV